MQKMNMCGIFGYIGKKQTAPNIVLEGLKVLEYRGYDSWGIAAENKTKQKTTMLVEKHIGKIGTAVLSSKFSIPSSCAIGHTRWATHGGVTKLNAHPHLDCKKRIAVVHNGIVENFQELKKSLLQRNHTFHSETDTEVIAHLIEEKLKTNDFANAVREAFIQLQGMNAIVVISTQTQKIIAAKTGSPLVVGIGKDAFFIASDATGIVKHTKDVIFLEDNQMVILDKKTTLLQLPDGAEITPKITKLSWTFEEAKKGNFPHFIIKEIYDQPKVITNIALTQLDQAMILAKEITNAYGTFLLGCGTASYAALAGTYLFSRIAKHHVNFSLGSEFAYLEDYLTKKSLLIPISQSGETIDIVEPVAHAKQKGVKIAALVNVLGSTLYRQADHPILLGAGLENAVVATKSLIAMISLLFLTAYTMINQQKEAQKLLLKASENITDLLKEPSLKKIKKLTQILKGHEHLYLIGRGLSYATAMEATLKIKETACVHAEGFAGGELKHGVIALIEKGTPCFIFAPEDESYDSIISNAQEVKARGGYLIGIGPKNNAVFDCFFETANCKEVTMLPQLVIAQLFAYYLALARGITDPDKPRNLAKSVTVK
jgi:glutamine---fructose-6-phosphate transaminase (isomerizing)